jgi:hypothetical protein
MRGMQMSGDAMSQRVEPSWPVVALSVAIIVMTPVLVQAGAEDPQVTERRAISAKNVPAAREELTFAFVMPAWLPPGYSLEHLAWFSPDEITGHTASSIDAWYSAPGQPYIHVWQSDNPELGQDDPVLVGDLLEIARDESWSAVQGARGLDTDAATILSARMSDGTTISVDSGVPIDLLIRVVESLVADDAK